MVPTVFVGPLIDKLLYHVMPYLEVTQAVPSGWRCSTLHAVLHAHLKVNTHHCRTEIQISQMLPQYNDRFTYTTFTFTCCFIHIRVIWTLIYLVFLYIVALSLGEKRGQNCSRLSCPLVGKQTAGWGLRGTGGPGGEAGHLVSHLLLYLSLCS